MTSAAPVLELLQEPFRDKPFSLRDWPFAFPPEYELSERTQRGVTERLVAAWLYAEHRFAGGAREDLPDDVVRHIRSVGTRLMELLRKSSDAADEDCNESHPRSAHRAQRHPADEPGGGAGRGEPAVRAVQRPQGP